MPVKDRSQLVIGKEYFLALDNNPDEAIKIILMEIDFPSWAYPDLARIIVKEKVFEMCFFLWEVGLGETKEEAAINFQKIK
jgi:hypothetical protein